MDRTKKDEIRMVKDFISHHSVFDQVFIIWRLMSLAFEQRRYIELLLDVHGYQIFMNGRFNGGKASNYSEYFSFGPSNVVLSYDL